MKEESSKEWPITDNKDNFPEAVEEFFKTENCSDNYFEGIINHYQDCKNHLQEENGWGETLSSFHAARAALISNSPASYPLEKFIDHYSAPIEEKEDSRELVETILKGKSMTILSYGPIFGSALGAIAQAPAELYLPAAAAGAYMNLRGEVEYMTAEKTLEDLAERQNQDREELISEEAENIEEDIEKWLDKKLPDRLYRRKPSIFIDAGPHRYAEGTEY